MNYNELTPVQKHVVESMHYISMSKDVNSFKKYTPPEKILKTFFAPKGRLTIFHKRYTKTNGDIWRRAYINECLRLAEIPKRIPGYTNERARREAKEVVDYVRGEYRRAKC